MSVKAWPISVWASDGKIKAVLEGPLDPGQITNGFLGSHKYWGADEVAELRALRKRGEKYRGIALALGRTYDSVRAKGQSLRRLPRGPG